MMQVSLVPRKSGMEFLQYMEDLKLCTIQAKAVQATTYRTTASLGKYKIRNFREVV
jgi:hypothetical protein